MDAICDDLAAEHRVLDDIVAAVPESAWDTPTPAEGWTVRDQISHLWFFDQRALLAMTDPDAFAADAAWLMDAGGTEASVAPGREMAAADLLSAWRADRHRLLERSRQLDPSTRVKWYGPSMAARSFITARLMETGARSARRRFAPPEDSAASIAAASRCATASVRQTFPVRSNIRSSSLAR